MVPEPVGSFALGRVIARSFSTLFRNFFKFFAIALTIEVPVLLLVAGLLGWVGAGADAETLSRGDRVPEAVAALGAALILAVLAFLLVQAATVNGAIQHLYGQPVSIGRSLNAAFRRLATLAGVALIVVAVSCGAVGIGAALLFVPGVGEVLGGLAIFAAVVFMVYLFLRWWVVVPIVVVESQGVLGSLSRAARLTAGRRWAILGLLLLMWLIAFVASILVQAPVVVIAGDVLGDLAGVAVNVVVTALFAIAAAISYHDLRVEKDGPPGEEIAAVFD